MSATPTTPARTCDATAVVATPSGRGAVAVVVVEGGDATQVVGDCFRPARGSELAARDIGRIVFGRWGGEDAAGEEVVACRRSATCVEVHCHGGAAAVARILDDLAERGAEVVDWHDWRLENADDSIAAEADLALVQTTTERAARVLLDQRQGALRSAIEAGIDAIDEGKFDAARAMLATLLDRWRVGRKLVEPWRIVLAGRPNVGKSSLINRLLGYERAIVFDQPGTTRDVVTAATALDGWPCELSDTAGLCESGNAIERAGVERAMAQLARADLVVWVEEVGRKQETEFRRQEELGKRPATGGGNGATVSDSRLMLGDIIHLLSPDSCLPIPDSPSRAIPMIRVRNKCDLQGTADESSFGEAVRTSAKTGEGVAELAAAIVSRLAQHAPDRGEAAPFTQRQARLLETAADAIDDARFDAATTALWSIVEDALG